MKPWPVLALGVGAGLLVPWAVGAAVWLSSPGLWPTGPLENFVVATVGLRTFLFFSLRRVRTLSSGSSVVFFAGDVLVLPGSFFALLATGDPAYGDFAKSFLASWLSAGLVVYPLVAASVVIGLARKRAPLSYVVPSAGICFGVSSLVSQALPGYDGVGGLSGVAQYAFGALRQPLPSSPWVTSISTVSGALVFASLAAYSVLAAASPGDDLGPRLGLGALGVGALLALIRLVPSGDPWAAFVVPAVTIVTGIWVVTREK